MIAFRRYQICPEFDVWKRRYRENTKEPNIDLAFLKLHTYFQWEDPSPFQQSLWKHPRHPYVAIPTLQKARIDFQSQSPPKIHLDKLVLGITPSLLNRFLRFQRRCNLLIQTFPTMYDTTRFSEGISNEEQVNQNTECSGSCPPEQVLKRK